MRTIAAGVASGFLCFSTLASLAIAAETPAAPAVRVVGSEDPVQSRKRGMCANNLSQEDFRAMAPGVSWFYSWHFQTKDLPPTGVNVEFVPMVWGNDAERLEGFKAYMEKNGATNKPRAVLALNEPNLKGQCFITPEEAAKSYLQIKEVADKYGVTTIGPHMALGSAIKDSITAMDPLEKKEVTYTFMVPYLKAFLHYTGKTEVPATAWHSYGDIHEMRWAVGMMIKDFDRPTWVTEYAFWKAKSPEDSLKYLIQSTDMLERTKGVAGYAWFKERVGENKNISLFEKESGKLSPMGVAYVNMPVHDEDLYYRLPGRLQAERYVTLEKMDISATTDADGFLQMSSTNAGGKLGLNVFTDAAGSYVLKIRTGEGAGTIQILRGDTVLGTVKSADRTWQTLETPVELAAGAQKIELRFEKSNQAVNWIEVGKASAK